QGRRPCAASRRPDTCTPPTRRQKLQIRSCTAEAIHTCKLNGLDPQRYFTDLLTRLVNGWPNDRIDELMSWHWADPKTPSASPEGGKGP
ncbi:transposase domain-containing protein, partial [Dankookia rubra]|uniref:transposase domain-containing protein n=1 Tax=Dankookia rubra TaxID=1442381 RepID=UPI001F4FC748